MSTTEPTDETRKALERAWADGYSQGATPGQPRPGNPWSARVSGIWKALTDDQRLATLLFVEQQGDDLFAAPVTVGSDYADERAVGLPAEATSLCVDLRVWLGLSGRIRWDVLMSRAATVEGFDTLRSMERLTPGVPILNLSGRRHAEREELRSAMRAFAVPSPPAPDEDREPQPGDGPDYHAEHAAWVARRGAALIASLRFGADQLGRQHKSYGCAGCSICTARNTMEEAADELEARRSPVPPSAPTPDVAASIEAIDADIRVVESWWAEEGLQQANYSGVRDGLIRARGIVAEVAALRVSAPETGPNTPGTYWYGAGCEEDDRG